MEKEYVSALRGFLNEAGYTNSGITLTSMVDEEGTRAYIATIHHERIDKMTEPEREDLRLQLTLLQFPATQEIYHEFLITN